jgi:hypothetical protein
MGRRNFLLSSAAFVSALAARAQTGSSKLIVEVSYTGSGTVNESHKIHVVLWDTPGFVNANDPAMPIAIEAIASKSAPAQFDGVQKNPVYVSMVYDPAGRWDAASAPPSGSSLGLYATTEPGTPAPVQLQPGKTTKITATFDDSFKMQ